MMGSRIVGKRVQGLHAGRLKHDHNYAEREFADEWARANGDGFILAHLLGVPPTGRDHVVAATVVQWLGSSVGLAFVENALKSIETRKATR